MRAHKVRLRAWTPNWRFLPSAPHYCILYTAVLVFVRHLLSIFIQFISILTRYTINSTRAQQHKVPLQDVPGGVAQEQSEKSAQHLTEKATI